MFCQTIVIYFLTIFGFVVASLPARRRYMAGLLANQYAGNFPPAAYEYRSRWSLLGLPLVHVRLGDRFDVLRGPVKAWIAIGSSHAVGVIFASGGIAIAPVSFGGIAIGLLPFGAIGLGWFRWAPSVSVSGLLADWPSAGRPVAVAPSPGMRRRVDWRLPMILRDGGIAYAAQANTKIAAQFLQQNLFFRYALWVSNHAFWLILLSAIPVTLQARLAARARRRREN